MKCSNIVNPINFGECSDKLNHVNQPYIGCEVIFTDLNGNKTKGTIVNIKHKKDGTVKYKIKAI